MGPGWVKDTGETTPRTSRTGGEAARGDLPCERFGVLISFSIMAWPPQLLPAPAEPAHFPSGGPCRVGAAPRSYYRDRFPLSGTATGISLSRSTSISTAEPHVGFNEVLDRPSGGKATAGCIGGLIRGGLEILSGALPAQNWFSGAGGVCGKLTGRVARSFGRRYVLPDWTSWLSPKNAPRGSRPDPNLPGERRLSSPEPACLT